MDKYEILKTYYGFQTFRSIQEKAIDSILSYMDTFVIMATGGGKSLIFQIPGLIFDGLTIVISPLISLMQDQVSQLKKRNISARTINSNQEWFEEKEAFEEILHGKLKFLYISPERLENTSFLEKIAHANISQIVLDESHCVTWGLDFRPSYLHIKSFIDSLPKRPVIACFTATASSNVVSIIKESLKIEPNIIQASFDRPNLYYETVHTTNKKEYLLEFIKRHRSLYGIVYTLTRKKAEELFQLILDLGYNVSLYHGGLDEDTRKKYQEEFLSGQTNIMICTNSFGMGIDKPNIRYIINYDLPESIEDLSQQQGRCSRDGNKGVCILLYNESDLYINEYFINSVEDNQFLSEDEIKKLKKEKRRKLQDVIKYATTKRCLHEYLVSYFGELYMSYCDNCSNCINSYEYQEVLKEAKIILDMIRSYPSRFGANLLAETLCGMKTDGVRRNRLNYSPFFNKLSLSKDRIKEIIYNMLDNRYLKKSDGRYPVIDIGFEASEVKGLKEYKIRLFKENGILDTILNKTVSLKDQLINLTNLVANRQGIPKYMILNEQTINEIVRVKPRTWEELTSIKGIKDRKAFKYGYQILEIVKRNL